MIWVLSFQPIPYAFQFPHISYKLTAVESPTRAGLSNLCDFTDVPTTRNSFVSYLLLTPWPWISFQDPAQVSLSGSFPFLTQREMMLLSLCRILLDFVFPINTRMPEHIRCSPHQMSVLSCWTVKFLKARSLFGHV